jgi:putative hydrolase of the HAD superfamily
MQNLLTDTTCWLFDLDNTLYSPYSNIFPQIHDRMGLYIMQRFGVDAERANAQRYDYFLRFGTTMRGLMIEHNIEAQEFMDFVHDVDLQAIAPDTHVTNLLHRLPGRKIIFTNADRKHASRILNHLNLASHFEDIFDIADGDYICKPDKRAYETLLARYKLEASNCCMFDDMQVNLKTAAELGMKTVWLRHAADWLRVKPDTAQHYPHCHYVADDLIPFLEQLLDFRKNGTR